MKKSITALATILLVIFSTVSLSSCKKSESGSPSGTSGLAAGKCRVKATFTGAYSGTFTSVDAMSMVVNNGSYSNMGASNVNTSTLVTEQFMILMPINATVKSYTQADLGPVSSFAYNKTNTTAGTTMAWVAVDSKPFTFTVTKSTSAEIEGTFSGTMTNDTDNTSVQVNGSFAAVY